MDVITFLPHYSAYLDSMANVIQHVVVDGLPDVAHWPLWIGWSYNFMSARRVFIGSQDADLPPRYLLLVNVNGLEEEKWRTSKLRKNPKTKSQKHSTLILMRQCSELKHEL